MRCFWIFLTLLLVANLKTSLSITTKGSNAKIVIVGAGAAGVSAAVKLLEYGFKNVIILEADKRIGGRIHTIPFAENIIDLGAQWCHGEKGNVVYDLAYKEGLLQHSNSVTQNTTYIRSNGQILPVALKNRLERISENIQAKLENVENMKVSIGSFLSTQFNKELKLSKNNDIDKTIAQEYYSNAEKEQSADEGADSLYLISGWDSNLYASIDGDSELQWKGKGYKEFLNLIMKTRQTGKEFGILDAKIKLSKNVKSINWKRANTKALIECTDGEKIEADHVIVTVSLGVLKAKLASMFTPALPTQKQTIIKSMQFGAYNKIFLEFPQRFWSKNMGMLYFLWRESDLKQLRTTKYAWLESLYGFQSVPYQPNVLEGWIIGPNSRKLEIMPLSEIKAGCMYLLEKFLRTEIPEPKNVLTSRWFSDPYIRGCYSYHSMETEKSKLTNQHLAKAINTNCVANQAATNKCQKPILQFAGEATSSKHYTTVHGAVESGFREAKLLRDFYK